MRAYEERVSADDQRNTEARRQITDSFGKSFDLGVHVGDVVLEVLDLRMNFLDQIVFLLREVFDSSALFANFSKHFILLVGQGIHPSETAEPTKLIRANTNMMSYGAWDS